jgi:nucleoside-diphosphate-sugar epimerase
MVLVTGATGFIGKNLVPDLARDRKIRILVRRTSDLSFYRDRSEIELAFGSLEGNEGLDRALIGVKTVIHAAGQTMGRNREDFYRTNVQGTRNLTDAMRKIGSIRMIFLSSHAACGASPFNRLISETTRPAPISDYGCSKLQAEGVVAQSGISHIILRPPSVYGPYDMEILKYVRLIDRGICPMIGIRESYLSLIYVRDLVGIIRKVMADDRFDNRIYFASDGRAYAFSEIVAAIARQLNRRRLWRIPIPVRIGLLYGVLNDALIPVRKRIISRDKVRELARQYWLCSNERMIREIGYIPVFDLDQGMTETVGWYREHGLIK